MNNMLLPKECTHIFWPRNVYFTSSSWSFSAVHLRAVANRISDTINSLPTELNLSISPESSSSFIFRIIIFYFIFCIIIFYFPHHHYHFSRRPASKGGLSKETGFHGKSSGESVIITFEILHRFSDLGQCECVFRLRINSVFRYFDNVAQKMPIWTVSGLWKIQRRRRGSRDFEPINTSGSHSNIYIWIVPFVIVFLFLHYIVAVVCCTAAGERSTD